MAEETVDLACGGNKAEGAVGLYLNPRGFLVVVE